MTKLFRAYATRFLASVIVGAAVLTFTPLLGGWLATPAHAQYIVDAEFRDALSPYGRWVNHSRWGEVWIPDPVLADWRPYTRGRWIYTDDWGWYWEPSDEEAAWGWVAYHYGRWALDPDLGWIWIPGQEWAPAWVDWRQGDDYVGWAPLPPDDLLVEYRDDPVYWNFVQPRYLLAPRVFLVCVPPRNRVVVFRRTVIVHRGDRDRDRPRAGGRRNAGIDPGIVARATGKPIRAAKVEPAVLRGTKVEGTREVDAKEGARARATVTTTNTLIAPTGKAERPRESGVSEKGRRLGSDQDRSSPPTINIIRGGVASESWRNGSSQPVIKERERQVSPQSPQPPIVTRERSGEAARANFPPPPVVRRTPPPPPAVMRTSPPPAAFVQQRGQEVRSNNGNNGNNGNRQSGRQQQQQQDPRLR